MKRVLVLEIYVRKLSTNQIARFFKLLYLLNHSTVFYIFFCIKIEYHKGTSTIDFHFFKRTLAVKVWPTHPPLLNGQHFKIKCWMRKCHCWWHKRFGDIINTKHIEMNTICDLFQCLYIELIMTQKFINISRQLENYNSYWNCSQQQPSLSALVDIYIFTGVDFKLSEITGVQNISPGSCKTKLPHTQVCGTNLTGLRGT